jgi:hypothetical protein
MILNEEKLTALFFRQKELNHIINPEWETDRTLDDFRMAAFVESGELLDHLDYKWWKQGEMDITQAKVEVSDIWFFVLSHIILAFEQHDDSEQYKDALLDMVGKLSNRIDSSIKIADEIKVDDVFACITLLMRYMEDETNIVYFHQLSYTEKKLRRVHILFQLMRLTHTMNMTFDELYDIYMGKLILNVFRQKNGYTDGSYTKIWNGLEDNEVLYGIMMETSDSEEIERLLTQEYKLITK